MRKTLGLFFVLALLLAGCSQNTPTNDNVSSSQNNVAEDANSDSSSNPPETESNDSDQPFVIEDCVLYLNKYANSTDYEFNLTIRNTSGRTIEDPGLSFDFLDSNKDILWSTISSHTGVVKDGQSYIETVFLDDSDFEFSLVNDFRYISITAYGCADYTRTDGATRSTKTISDPQLFTLS